MCICYDTFYAVNYTLNQTYSQVYYKQENKSATYIVCIYSVLYKYTKTV